MKKIGILLFVSLVLLSCDSIKVVSDYDKTEDFTEHESLYYYGWADNSDEIMTRFDKERIEHAFGYEFKRRGVEVVKDSTEADLIVTLLIVTKEKVAKSATTTSMGGGYGGYGYGGYGYGRYGHGPSYGWGGGTSHTTINEDEYTEGTLVVAVYDATEKKLIWQGIGKKTIVEKTEGREERIKKTVAKIMSKYPVAPLKKK